MRMNFRLRFHKVLNLVREESFLVQKLMRILLAFAIVLLALDLLVRPHITIYIPSRI